MTAFTLNHQSYCYDRDHVDHKTENIFLLLYKDCRPLGIEKAYYFTLGSLAEFSQSQLSLDCFGFLMRMTGLHANLLSYSLIWILLKIS